MKKTLSIILSAIFAASALASCADSTSASTASSSAYTADIAWLEARLGEMPDNVTVGLASDLGIDMTSFENDGYLIRTNDGETVVCAKSADGLDRAVRKYAKAYGSGKVADVTYHEGYRIEDLRIAGNSIADYTVVYPADRNENLDFAVSELTRLVEKACGAKLATAEGTADGHKIVFAQTDDESLGTDGFTYEVKDGDLYITGAVKRGCMNGVWRFLENECMWDGLIYGDSVLAEADLVDIPEGTKKTEVPAFPYLDIYCSGYTQGCAKFFETDRKKPSNAQNSYGYIERACHGMQYNQFCGDECLYRQICYTDEYRYEECLESVCAYVDRRLDAGQRIGYEFKFVDIAQGDNGDFCDCKRCREVFREEGGNAGAMIRFSNRLSEEVNGLYPSDEGLYFLVFAYSGTNVAPKITVPNGYIWVTFCFDVNCSNHALNTNECTNGVKIAYRETRYNSTYTEWFEGWTALTSQLYAWYYTLESGILRYTELENLYDNLCYFRDCKITGIFVECESPGLGTNPVEHIMANEFSWDPDMSREEFDALLMKVLEREYGDGYEDVRAYIDLLIKQQNEVDCWDCWHWWNGMTLARFGFKAFKDNCDTMTYFAESAVRMANSAKQERYARLILADVYAKICYLGYADAYISGDTAEIERLCDLYAKMYSYYIDAGITADKLRVTCSNVVYESTLEKEVWTNWVSQNDLIYSALMKMTPPEGIK